MQGFCVGDGWIYHHLNRFRLHVYDEAFAAKIHDLIGEIEAEFSLTRSESERTDRLTGTREWSFELGGAFAVDGLDLGLSRSPEGPYFFAGLWDADGSWTLPDQSHPHGQAKFFGGWHAVYVVKRNMKHLFGIATGRMFVATEAGHTSMIGSHRVITRTNVYGTIVRSKSMEAWIGLVGSKMMLKGRLTNHGH